MNTVTPIIIPMSYEADRCPKCGREESIKQVCAHCGHEYESEEPPLDAIQKVMIAVLIAGALWLICTSIAWLVEQTGYGSHPSFLDIIQGQWEFVKGLRLW